MHFPGHVSINAIVPLYFFCLSEHEDFVKSSGAALQPRVERQRVSHSTVDAKDD